MVYVNDDSDANQLQTAGTHNCLDCDINFSSEEYLLEHLHRHHIKQPKVVLIRDYVTPIKLTIKATKGEGFRIVPTKSPTLINTFDTNTTFVSSEINTVHENDVRLDLNSEIVNNNFERKESDDLFDNNNMQTENVDILERTETDSTISTDDFIKTNQTDYEMNEFNSDNGDVIVGGEPTPPPETSEVPKIRIKTGLLQAHLSENGRTFESIEEIRTPGTLQNGESLSSLFKNNDRAKDLGFTTSDPDSMDIMQPFSTAANSMVANNPLASISQIPMQELAQQVSRLQNSTGMQQQNVLINIQHFQQPQPPPPPLPNNYPMYPQQIPQPAQAPPGYQPGQPPRFHYPQTGPYFYPPGYPQPVQMPPQRPQTPQGSPMAPPMRPPGPPMGPGNRTCGPMRYPTQRGQVAPNAYHMPQNGPHGRPYFPSHQRPPLHVQQRPRMATKPTPPRPKNSILQSTLTSRTPSPTTKSLRRIAPAPDSKALVKKMRIDTLIPDKNDDDDCEVVAVTQKGTNLPQIQSIQGNVTEPNPRQLTESITVTTIPPTKSPKQRESRTEAKEVANVLAARGITVTTAPRPREHSPSPSPTSSNNAVSINLNSSVCIIPQKKKDDSASNTVDLTEDVVAEQRRSQPSTSTAMKQPPPPPPRGSSNNHPQEFECHLCTAKYATSALLIKHRKTYHRTNEGPEFGIPLVDLKTPGVTQKLINYGIFHYIPLPNSNPNQMFALPILCADQKLNNTQELATSILTLGPIKSISPRPVVKRGKPTTSNAQPSSTNSS